MTGKGGRNRCPDAEIGTPRQPEQPDSEDIAAHQALPSLITASEMPVVRGVHLINKL